MSYRTGLIIVSTLLALSLVFNIGAFMRISDLQSELTGFREWSSNRLSNITFQLDNIEHAIDEFEASQTWTTPIAWDIDLEEATEPCTGPMPVTADWTFRELDANASPLIALREEGAETWQEVEAEEVGNLAYRATMTLAPDNAWEYRIVAIGDQGSRSTEPQPLHELSALSERNAVLMTGDRYRDGDREWHRLILENQVSQLSQCNTIVDATLVLDGESDDERRVGIGKEFPGNVPPAEASTPDTGSSSSSQADSGVAVDSTAPGRDDNGRIWWSEWIELDEHEEIWAELEYADGSTERIELDLRI
jgi:hypothetical protein